MTDPRLKKIGMTMKPMPSEPMPTNANTERSDFLKKKLLYGIVLSKRIP